jgi:hypothetical protein
MAHRQFLLFCRMRQQPGFLAPPQAKGVKKRLYALYSLRDKESGGG